LVDSGRCKSMMRSPVIRLCCIVILFFSFSSAAGKDELKKTPVSTAIPQADVLILHDSVGGGNSPGVLDGNTVADLLGHFGLKGFVSSIGEYRAGDSSKYRFIIILSVDDRKIPFPESLLSNLRSAAVPIFWIGNHLPDMTSDAQFLSKIGFRISGSMITKGFTMVHYKGIALPKNEPSINPIEILNPAKAQIMATAQSTNGKPLPYIVRSGDFWFCADSPLSYADEGDRYLVFCDILHDFLKMQHQEEKNALLRLEDVTVEEDPAILRKIADHLYDRHVPFQISLVPIFINPEDKDNPEVYLSDRPEFVSAIRYMVSKGGAVVMHGATHQYKGKSADDYEFWDALSDHPVAGDSRVLVEKKLRLGLEECFKNGIYPLTWETPHYAGSQLDYKVFAEHFNSAYESVLSSDQADSGHFFPYTTVDRFGRFIIPEDLGYIPEEKPDPSALIKNCERLKVVRDGVASFYFHPFINLKYLEEVLDGIEDNGYHFISIRDYDLRMQMDSRLVQTYTDKVQLPMKDMFLHRFLLDESGHRSGESYSKQKQTGIFKDPGIVPSGNVLIIEGVPEVIWQGEPEAPSVWSKIQSWFQHKFSKSPPPHNLIQPEAIILCNDSLGKGDWNDQQSFISAFSAFGFRVSTINQKDYSKSSAVTGSVLVVPRGVAMKLSAGQNQWIEEFVRKGGCLVVDGPCPLSQMLGIRFESRSLKVREVMSEANWFSRLRPENPKWPLTWNPPATVVRFSTRNAIAVFAEDKESELPLAVLAQYGQGRLLYMGARLDPITPLGYTRFPYFIHYVLDGFNLELPLGQKQLELYFDPGYGPSRGIERLAEEWRAQGVRAIYAAAYHFWPTWSYDYSRLIDVCHKNGILVYAWLELPHVSAKFWDDHPNWRAKTPTGKDGLVGWRHHMDLDNPECQDAVYNFVEELLKQNPWDGVNIAELNYDTNNGPEDPQNYLPMGKTTREAFKALGGFDPIMLFSPDSLYYWKNNPTALKKFEEYRAQRVMAWHRSLLERISPMAQAKDMEIIVTMMDSLHSPTVTRDTGVDSRRIVSLMDQFPITLQVEDPAHYWAQSPDRYKEFTKTYLKLVRDPKRLMFDINVVDRDIRYSHSPSERPIGIELARAFMEASQASGRASIYSEYMLPQEDLKTLSNVLAHNATLESRENSWVIRSDTPVSLTSSGDWQNFKVDNIFWPGWGENEILLPSGTHQITSMEKKFRLFNTSILDIRLLWFTGNLDAIKRTERGFQFSYESNLRSMALFNKRPFGMMVDGAAYADPPMMNAGVWSVRLPRGRHNVQVLADSTAITILEKTSLYGSTVIVAFGIVACSLMLLIYFSVLARRAVGRTTNQSRQSQS
jgi:uncharacterized protein YdaL